MQKREAGKKINLVIVEAMQGFGIDDVLFLRVAYEDWTLPDPSG